MPSPPVPVRPRLNPVALLDQAFSLLRRATSAQLLSGVLAGLPLAAATLLLYYLERVVGIHVSLPLFALLLSLALYIRFAVLSRLARELVQLLAPGVSWPKPAAPFGLADSNTAAWAGFGLCLWSLPLLFLARSSLFALLACLPLAGLRTSLMPSFLARAACSPETGATVVAHAWDDARADRGTWLGLAALSSACLPLLLSNLYALTALLLGLASSVLGLDVTAIGEFLSPDNDAVVLLFLGVALMLLEPLRAALSALAFHEASCRKDGTDLRAMIARLKLLALVLCLITSALSLTSPAAAEPVSDEAVRERAREVLQRSEFRDFGAAEQAHWRVWHWLEEALRKRAQKDREKKDASPFELHVSQQLIVVVSGLLLAFMVFHLWRFLRDRAAASDPTPVEPAAPQNPPTHSPPAALEQQLMAARRAAADGDYATGVRLLYNVVLVLLARSRAFHLDAARTNGEYLAAVTPGATHDGFAGVIERFERSHYGLVSARAEDYELVHDYTQRLLAPSGDGTP